VGGNVVEYYHLAARMPLGQPFIGIQASGLDDKRPLSSRVEEIAAEYVEEVRQFQPHGPYYLGGSSFGGLVAFEMARQLRAAGEPVGLVALFDTYGPGYPQWLPGMTRWRQDLLSGWWRLKAWVSDLRLLRGRSRRQYFLEKVRNSMAKARRWSRKQVRHVRRAIDHRLLPETLRKVERAGQAAARRYVPGVYPGKVTLFRARHQPDGIRHDETNGLAGLAAGGIDVHIVEGRHAFMVREPEVGFLAPVFCECLELAQRQYQSAASPAGDISLLAHRQAAASTA